MESKNLDKAIEIYSKLISGEEICKKHPDNGPLYDEFYGNAEVYDIVMNMMKKMNLSLYEYNDSLYITAGEGNRVFGYTNDDMKKLLGLRLLLHYVYDTSLFLQGFIQLSVQGVCEVREHYR